MEVLPYDLIIEMQHILGYSFNLGEQMSPEWLTDKLFDRH